MPRATCAVWAAAALSLVGCGGTEQSRYYLLDGANDPAPGYSAPGQLDRLIYVDRVQVARYVDRPELVTRADASRVTFASLDVWAEPLQDVLTRAIVDELGRELSFGDVLVTPDRRDVAPAARVTVEVLRFDGDAAGAMTLEARWMLLTTADERLVATGRERIVERSAPPATSASRVAALERAVAQFASRLATEIRVRLPRN